MSKLLINEPPLQILPSLAVRIGLNEAIFVQQLHYWLQRAETEAMDCKWVYNTTDQWIAQFPFWSEKTIRRIIDSLREKQIIRTVRLNASNRDQTLYFTLCYDNLQPPSGQYDHIGVANMTTSDLVNMTTSSLSEILSENTTEINNPISKKPEIDPIKKVKPAITLKTYLADCDSLGIKAVAEDDPIFDYAESVGLPLDWLHLCWRVFVRDFIDQPKKQKSWPAHFRNCVRNNWKKLWWVTPDNKFEITSIGRQAQIEFGGVRL